MQLHEYMQEIYDSAKKELGSKGARELVCATFSTTLQKAQEDGIKDVIGEVEKEFADLYKIFVKKNNAA